MLKKLYTIALRQEEEKMAMRKIDTYATQKGFSIPIHRWWETKSTFQKRREEFFALLSEIQEMERCWEENQQLIWLKYQYLIKRSRKKSRSYRRKASCISQQYPFCLNPYLDYSKLKTAIRKQQEKLEVLQRHVARAQREERMHFLQQEFDKNKSNTKRIVIISLDYERNSKPSSYYLENLILKIGEEGAASGCCERNGIFYYYKPVGRKEINQEDMEEILTFWKPKDIQNLLVAHCNY